MGGSADLLTMLLIVPFCPAAMNWTRTVEVSSSAPNAHTARQSSPSPPSAAPSWASKAGVGDPSALTVPAVTPPSS